jgi:intracellular septation protein
LPDVFKKSLSGMTFRVSLFFLFHACLAYFAALNWTTEHWALLKGVGLTVSFVIYLLCEVIYLRLKVGVSVKK